MKLTFIEKIRCGTWLVCGRSGLIVSESTKGCIQSIDVRRVDASGGVVHGRTEFPLVEPPVKARPMPRGHSLRAVSLSGEYVVTSFEEYAGSTSKKNHKIVLFICSNNRLEIVNEYIKHKSDCIQISDIGEMIVITDSVFETICYKLNEPEIRRPAPKPCSSQSVWVARSERFVAIANRGRDVMIVRGEDPQPIVVEGVDVGRFAWCENYSDGRFAFASRAGIIDSENKVILSTNAEISCFAILRDGRIVVCIEVVRSGFVRIGLFEVVGGELVRLESFDSIARAHSIRFVHEIHEMPDGTLALVVVRPREEMAVVRVSL